MGFRNAYAVARDSSDELFTFDSDTEFEIGLPWYRPTRVLHCVSGADFGWRRGALKTPESAPDTLPLLLSLGPGSPTAVLFATGAAFPARYRQALFVADWSFGRLLAVHLQRRGAGFAAQSEEIITGTPLPISAACINPKDGALYFVTGGRKTQSVLYRLTWHGPDRPINAPPRTSDITALEQRRNLEQFHGHVDPAAVAATWPHLGSDNSILRHAARIALESQPLSGWQDRALAERQPRAALTALLALSRRSEPAAERKVLDDLGLMNWQQLGPLRSDWLRIVWLAFSRLGEPSVNLREQWTQLLSPHFPSGDQALDGPLCELLVYLQSPDIARKTIGQLTDQNTHEQQLHFGRCLSTLTVGWTPELRDSYFDWLARASAWRGGASFPAFLQRFRGNALASAPPSDRPRLDERLKATVPSARKGESGNATRPIVKEWALDELAALAERRSSTGNVSRGRIAFIAARCAACHTFAGEGGAVGMDLTAVSRRLNTHELLEAIFDPSKEISDQYGAVVITHSDGRQVTGRVVNFAGGAIHISTDLFDPATVTKIPEAEIESVTRSKVSLMPAGLLNVLQGDEVIDLLAYLKSGANQP
jgi:putative heme-binding domain-containing protein